MAKNVEWAFEIPIRRENFMTMARLLRGLVLALVGAAFATAAGAVDMTGTWEGRESCHCFNEVDV